MTIREIINQFDDYITKKGIIYLTIILLIVLVGFCINSRLKHSSLQNRYISTYCRLVEVNYYEPSYTLKYEFYIDTTRHTGTIDISSNELNYYNNRSGHFFKVHYSPLDIDNNEIMIDSFVKFREINRIFRNKFNPYRNNMFLKIDSFGIETKATIVNSYRDIIGRTFTSYKYIVGDTAFTFELGNYRTNYKIGSKFKLKYLDSDRVKNYLYFYESK